MGVLKMKFIPSIAIEYGLFALALATIVTVVGRQYADMLVGFIQGVTVAL